MKLKFIILLLASGIAFSASLSAQTISKEELIFLTSEWKGERFADGRPKLPDDLLERAKHIMIDDAWTVLKNEGYLNQFEGGWKTVNDTPMPGSRDSMLPEKCPNDARVSAGMPQLRVWRFEWIHS